MTSAAIPNSLHQLASALVAVHQRMVKEWEPIVEEHIASGCTDAAAIAATAWRDPPALMLPPWQRV